VPRRCLVVPTVFSSVALFVMMQFVPGQQPPWTPNPNAPGAVPQADHRFPVDEPQRTSPRGKQRPLDISKVKRDASELSTLAKEIPALVAQANKGVLPKDLNERLRQIEKLSKQLRRELTQ
jgi:hypothetical protein